MAKRKSNTNLIKISVIGLVVIVSMVLFAKFYTSDSSKKSRASEMVQTETEVPCLECANWQPVDFPQGKRGSHKIQDMDIIAPNDVWAVGDNSYTSTPTSTSYTMHWDGSSWSSIPSPQPGDRYNFLAGVSAVTSNNVWAVGHYYGYTDTVPHALILNWNGKTWQQYPIASTDRIQLREVAAISANDVWAVGTWDYNSPGKTLAMHWNGQSWSRVQTPNVGISANILLSVSGTSSQNVWAVGWSTGGSPASSTLTQRWNGTQWSVVQSPNLENLNLLNAVSVVPGTDLAWAVGYTDNWGTPGVTRVIKNLILLWNGQSWAVIPSPNIPNVDNQLENVSALSANDVWAVGKANNRATILHWNGQSWTISYQDSNLTAVTPLFAVDAYDASTVWAAGTNNGNLYSLKYSR